MMCGQRIDNAIVITKKHEEEYLYGSCTDVSSRLFDMALEASWPLLARAHKMQVIAPIIPDYSFG